MLSPSARLFERARDVQTALALRSRAFLDCIRETAVVFAANEETERLLNPYRAGRPLVRLPIASLPPEKIERFRRKEGGSDAGGVLRLFAGGNMEGRKGVSLALRALALAKSRGLKAHYTVAGGGPEIPALRKLAVSLGLAEEVLFHPGYRGEEYLRALQESNVYFLPSFRESTPVTLLEAYLAGCYPVVADTSAQGEIVRLAGGHAVPVGSMESLAEGLADALLWCGQNRERLVKLAGEAAKLVCSQFASERYDGILKQAYEEALRDKEGAP